MIRDAVCKLLDKCFTCCRDILSLNTVFFFCLFVYFFLGFFLTDSTTANVQPVSFLGMEPIEVNITVIRFVCFKMTRNKMVC